jgi:hypothetical protein
LSEGVVDMAEKARRVAFGRNDARISRCRRTRRRTGQCRRRDVTTPRWHLPAWEHVTARSPFRLHANTPATALPGGSPDLRTDRNRTENAPGDSTTSVPKHLCPIHATEFTQPYQTAHAATETDAPTGKRRTTAARTTSKQLGSEHEQANSTKDRETAREAAVRLSADGLPKISQRSAAPRRRGGRKAGGSLADQKAASGRKSLNDRILVARGPPFNPNPTSARADLVADRSRPVVECRESIFLPRRVSSPDISEEPFPTWGGFATVGVSWPGPPEVLAASNS